MRKIGLLAVFIYLLLPFSCKKDTSSPVSPICNCPVNCPPAPTFVARSYYRISKEAKAYAMFKPGTYWIYQDSASANLDSVYVTKLDTGITVDATAHDTCEWFDVYTGNSQDGLINILDVRRHRTRIDIEQAPHYCTGYILDSMLAMYNYAGTLNSNGQFYFGLPITSLSLIEFSGCDEGMDTATYTICSLPFTNLLRVNYHNSPTGISWIAKNYGLVRWQYHRPLATTWNMIRCHIVQ